jgi:hypothetical protein
MGALRRISTRATITPTRFYNYYDWGGLKADPRDLVRRYFDLFVYTMMPTGERSATLRFPADRIDRRLWRTYVAERRSAVTSNRCASLTPSGDVALLDLYPPEDPRTAGRREVDDDDAGEYWGNDDVGDWLADEQADQGSLAVPLALVRSDLLAGDLRALYLLWLSSVHVMSAVPPRSSRRGQQGWTAPRDCPACSRRSRNSCASTRTCSRWRSSRRDRDLGPLGR